MHRKKANPDYWWWIVQSASNDDSPWSFSSWTWIFSWTNKQHCRQRNVRLRSSALGSWKWQGISTDYNWPVDAHDGWLWNSTKDQAIFRHKASSLTRDHCMHWAHGARIHSESMEIPNKRSDKQTTQYEGGKGNSFRTSRLTSYIIKL